MTDRGMTDRGMTDRGMTDRGMTDADAYGPQNADTQSAEWDALRDALRARQDAGLTTFGVDLWEALRPLLRGGEAALQREGITYRNGLGYSVAGDRRYRTPDRLATLMMRERK